MKLVLGNKNYSSWSLRPWILLDAFGVQCEIISESLQLEGLSERLGKYSGAKKVPVLIDNELVVWDSIAICEYVSENNLNGQGWPEDKDDRAIARSVCAEMHAGFAALRKEMPMNCRAKRKVELSAAAKSDIARINDIWTSYAKKDADGNIRLFGKFSIADCFYAPVVFRFNTYGAELSEVANAYMQSMLDHPSMKKWLQLGISETEIIERGERGVNS